MKKNYLKIIFTALIIFIIIIFFLALKEDKRYTLENEIIGKEIDYFEIKYFSNNNIFTKKDLKPNKFYLINIWASWCLPCRKEHPQLMKLTNDEDLKMIGINYKDSKSNANKFLKNLGNPFDISLSDTDGTKTIFLGEFGVPESILLDPNKIIIKKFVGPINNQDVNFILNTVNEN